MRGKHQRRQGEDQETGDGAESLHAGLVKKSARRTIRRPAIVFAPPAGSAAKSF
jgi:hypothetical protein